MQTILYGGVRYTQVRAAIYCKKCEDTIESKYIHDFKYCSCGSVGIDGGLTESGRYMGDKSDMETRCMYNNTSHGKTRWLPPAIVEQHFIQPAGYYKMDGMHFKFSDPPPTQPPASL